MKFLNWLFGRTPAADTAPDPTPPVVRPPAVSALRPEPPPQESPPLTGWRAAQEANRQAVARHFTSGPHPIPTEPAIAVAQPAIIPARAEAAPTIQRPRLDPPLVVPAGDFRFIALDVETANDWCGSICQIGLACVGHDGRITTVSGLIDPECHFADFNIRLHGIWPTAVRGKPAFRDVFPQLAEALCHQPVVQHSTFDRGAIEAACQACGLAWPGIEWIDSVTIARRAWPELTGNGGHGLGNLKKVLGLTFDHHDAGEDARAAAQVVLLAEQRTGLPFTEIPATRRRAVVPTGRKVRADGAPGGPLAGQIAVFTGALTMSREEAAVRAAVAGITVATSVSRKTTLLIVGDQDLTVLAGHSKSTKHRRAEELIAEGAAIRIIGETEFLALLSDPAGDALPQVAPPAPVAAPLRPKPPAVPADAVIVVFASELRIGRDAALAHAAGCGMQVMANMTKRTAIVVVADDHLSDPRTDQHRKALDRAANGQTLRIICESEFLAMTGRG